MAIDPDDYDDVNDLLEEIETRAEGIDVEDVLTDSFVAENTTFDSYDEMFDSASRAWVDEQLDL